MTKETKDVSVDIMGFDVVSPCEVPQEMEVMGVDGETKLGFSFMVLGAHAEAVKIHFKANTKSHMIQTSMAEKGGKEKEKEYTEKLVDNSENKAIEATAVRVVGWVNVKQEFSKQVLKDALRKNPHWRDQITNFSEKVGNFTK